MTKPAPRIRESRVVRRAQLIDEARYLVGRHGYHGFTIQALAERCAMSNAGVLHYFPSKDRLLMAVLDEIERRQEEHVAPFVQRALDTAQDAEGEAARLALFRAMVAHVAEDPGQARFLIALLVESLEPGHPAYAWFRDRENEATALFARLVSMTAARHLHALMHGLILQWLRADGGFDIIAQWDAGLRVVLSSVETPLS